MKMSGTRQIAAPQAEVWAKLNDIDVLKRCIPGCESLEKVGENDLKSTVAVKIGPMNVRFTGAVTLSDLNPPTSYRISGKGQGGPAGFASGGANVQLSPEAGGTLLAYDVDATVGGKIAQLGGRLIDATAASLANQFFDRFAAELAPASSQPAAASASVAPAANGAPLSPAESALASAEAALPDPGGATPDPMVAATVAIATAAAALIPHDRHPASRAAPTAGSTSNTATPASGGRPADSPPVAPPPTTLEAMIPLSGHRWLWAVLAVLAVIAAIYVAR